MPPPPLRGLISDTSNAMRAACSNSPCRPAAPRLLLLPRPPPRPVMRRRPPRTNLRLRRLSYPHLSPVPHPMRHLRQAQPARPILLYTRLLQCRYPNLRDLTVPSTRPRRRHSVPTQGRAEYRPRKLVLSGDCLSFSSAPLLRPKRWHTPAKVAPGLLQAKNALAVAHHPRYPMPAFRRQALRHFQDRYHERKSPECRRRALGPHLLPQVETFQLPLR